MQLPSAIVFHGASTICDPDAEVRMVTLERGPMRAVVVEVQGRSVEKRKYCYRRMNY